MWAANLKDNNFHAKLLEKPFGVKTSDFENNPNKIKKKPLVVFLKHSNFWIDQKEIFIRMSKIVDSSNKNFNKNTVLKNFNFLVNNIVNVEVFDLRGVLWDKV